MSSMSDDSGQDATSPSPAPDGENGDHYRTHLIESWQKSQVAYDKAVLALSAGALGVTINFVKDIIGGPPIAMWLLVLAWIAWAVSCAAILYSHFSSVAAHK